MSIKIKTHTIHTHFLSLPTMQTQTQHTAFWSTYMHFQAHQSNTECKNIRCTNTVTITRNRISCPFRNSLNLYPQHTNASFHAQAYSWFSFNKKTNKRKQTEVDSDSLLCKVFNAHVHLTEQILPKIQYRWINAVCLIIIVHEIHLNPPKSRTKLVPIE